MIVKAMKNNYFGERMSEKNSNHEITRHFKKMLTFWRIWFYFMFLSYLKTRAIKDS